MAEEKTETKPVSASTGNMLVKLESLDMLLTLAGEVIITSSNLEHSYKNLKRLYDHKESVDKESLELAKDLTSSTSHLSSNLHHLVQTIRTVDLKDLSFRCRRLVRDISRKTGKRILFDFIGEETCVDKTVVEKLYDPISHQLRNAIDHGIEENHLRVAKGKPEEGRITLRVFNTERDTLIEISDDGNGIDLDALLKVGIKQGKITPDTPFLTEEKAIELMCSPGVSTSATVSEVSGRGVGMDVVHDQLSSLGGNVTFKTEKGKGTTFSFQVPLLSAVNIMDGLVVRSGETVFAFPVSSVVSNMAVGKNEITSTLGKGRMIKYLDRMLPLSSLNYVLDKTDIPEESDTVPILVVEHKNDMVAYVISEFFSPQKLVIIPFDKSLSIDGLSGTTILGGRKLGFIVDVPRLIARTLRGEGRAAIKRDAGLILPVVDAKEAALTTTEPVVAKKTKEEAPQKEEERQFSIREFILEIEKLIPGLNSSVFALESDPGNEAEVNKAFRLLHTIKGNFIMIGYVSGGDTIHRVESVLDRVRSKQLAMTPDVVDILMDGISYIEEVVRESIDETWNDQVSEKIMELSAKLLPKSEKSKITGIDIVDAPVELTLESAHRAVNYQKRGVPFYRCYLEFDSGKQPPFLAACLIYKRFVEVADVLGMVPTLDDVEQGVMEGKLKLLIASEMNRALLEESLKTLLVDHYGVIVFSFTRFE